MNNVKDTDKEDLSSDLNNSNDKPKNRKLKSWITSCFSLDFWEEKQKLFIAYKLLFFLFVLLVIVVGALLLFGEENEMLFETVNILIYGVFNLMSLTIGFVAGASLDNK